MNAAVREVLDALHLSADDYRGLLGIGPDEVNRYLGPASPSATTVEHRMAPIIVLTERLFDAFRKDDVPQWLAAPNRSLNGRTPAEVIRAGDVPAVVGAIDDVEWGIFV